MKKKVKGVEVDVDGVEVDVKGIEVDVKGVKVDVKGFLHCTALIAAWSRPIVRQEGGSVVQMGWKAAPNL
eukprot:2727068-Pyramimonas_sp.AAC.3